MSCHGPNDNRQLLASAVGALILLALALVLVGCLSAQPTPTPPPSSAPTLTCEQEVNGYTLCASCTCVAPGKDICTGVLSACAPGTPQCSRLSCDDLRASGE